MNQQQQPQEMAIVVSQVENGQFYRLIQNSRNKIHIGPVKLAQFQESKKYFINIEQFCQNIIAGTPFVYIQNDAGLTLIFPHIDTGLNGIFIPQSNNLQMFQAQLNNVVQMVEFAQAMQIQQFRDTIELHCRDIATNPLNNPNDAAAYIAKGGDYLKQGFMFLGSMLATGINKGGEYINQKIEPGQEVQVNPDTKSKLNGAKEKVSSFFEFSGAKLSQLFKPVAEKTKELTNDLGQKIDQSDSNVLKQTKQLTCATWDAAGTALTGLGQALCEVGDSIGKNTKNIVQKKYGNDVAETYLGGVPPNQVGNEAADIHEPLLQLEPQQPPKPQQVEQ